MAFSSDISPPPGLFGNLGAFLRAELAPYPGRLDAVIRYGVCITLVILLTFFLQLPFLELGIVVIFFTVMENTVLTYLASGLVIAGALFVAVLDNLFLGLTLDYPFARIFFSSLLVFFGMYFFRVGGLIGNIGYMWSVCVIFLQSNMAALPVSEFMLRLNLWSTVVSVYPAVLACIVCTLVRPDFPSRSLPKEMLRQARAVVALLEDKINGEASRPLFPDIVGRDLARLHRLLEYAALEKKDIKRHKTRHLARISTLDRLYIAAAHISALPAMPLGPETRRALEEVKAACLDFYAALEEDRPFRLLGEMAVPGEEDAPLAAELREMRGALLALSLAADTALPSAEGEKMPLLAPDAASNPVYVRFALKTVLATLICLGIYKSTQWEGIHTCVLTCVILALPSLGATTQKGLLRVSGCFIGSVIALVASICIMPFLDDITGYILLCLAVLMPAAWVAMGSARSNYAGVQIAFAYALALMASSGPDINLIEIRDRLFGIILGVAVSTLVHSLIWPEKEELPLRRTMADLLRAAAAMAEAGLADSLEQRQARLREAESKAWNLLARCREIQGRVALEPGWNAGDRAFAVHSRRWIGDAQDLLFTLHARLAAAGRVPPDLADALREQADGLVSEAAPDISVLASLKPLEDVSA